MARDSDVGSERGIALLIALLTTLFVAALTAALVLTTTSESYTSRAFDAAQQTLYAAESAVEWSLAAVSAPGTDWPAIAAGTTTSSFTDGAFTGLRPLGDGTSLDLDAVAAENPGWHVYAYGAFDDLLPELNKLNGGLLCYVVALAAPDGPSPDRMKIRALSFGRRGARQAVEVTVIRVGSGAAAEFWRR